MNQERRETLVLTGYAMVFASSAVAAIWSLILIGGVFGLAGAIISFFILPFAMFIAPFVEGFVNQNWVPLITMYSLYFGAFAFLVYVSD